MDSINSDSNNPSSSSSNTDDRVPEHDDAILSDTESQTEGKPSPQLAVANQQHPSPSTETEGSPSPVRPKKRAIETMLDGEEDKTDCIVVEKHPPPLPTKQNTPPSSPSAMKISSPSYTTPFIDRPLYDKGDASYDQAHAFLERYRQQGDTLESGQPILEFFDKWVKETIPNAVCTVDALFGLLLETYDPKSDAPLVARIPLVMNQILQRKYIPHQRC
jgi:hypothetical protein